MISRAKLFGENREKMSYISNVGKRLFVLQSGEFSGEGEASEGNSFTPQLLPSPLFFAHPRRAPTLACWLVPSLRLENERKRLLRGPVHTPSKCVID